MKGNKFLAAVLAASMVLSAAPATALNVFAAVPSITKTTDGDPEIIDPIKSADLSGIDANITAGSLTGQMGHIMNQADSNVTAGDVTVDANVAASLKGDADSGYSVYYGSVSGTLQKNSKTYNYTVAADKLTNAQTGANLLRDLVKAYLTDKNVAANTVAVQNAVNAFTTTTDTTYSTARTALTTEANYIGSISDLHEYYTVAYNPATGKIVVTVGMGGTVDSDGDGIYEDGAKTATYSITATDVIPADGSSINASDITIEDSESEKSLISAFESAYSKNHTGVTYSNAAVTSYKASTHSADGKMDVRITLKDGEGNKSTVTFTNIALKHGLTIMKEEAEKAAKDALKTVRAESTINGKKLSEDGLKTALADYISSALTTAGVDNAGHNVDMLHTETDDYKRVSVDVDSYTPATISGEGSASGTIKLTYDYTRYNADGSFVDAGKSTDIEADSDLSAYQSEVSFNFVLDRLDEVDATAITGINASRTYVDPSTKKEATNKFGNTSITAFTLGARSKETVANVKTATATSGTIKYVNVTANFKPANANTYSVNWSSADDKIATVVADADDSAKAVITGITKGKTTIKAELVDADGKVVSTKSVKVTVNGFQFDDVQDMSKFFYDDVYTLYDNGIVSGTTATTYAPDQALTRGQFVQMLYKASGDTVTAESKFNDVPTSRFYAAAVTWAVKKGVTAGTSATTFSPDRTITRAEAMQMLYKAYGQGKTYNAALLNFADVSNNAYYKDAVYWAANNKITYGLNGTTFGVTDPCTRAQGATFIVAANSKLHTENS